MSNLYKLGLRDLPLDEVILIKTIFRLSNDQLSHLWVLVDEGPVDAWIADSASWNADLAHHAGRANATPVLYLGRIHNAALAPTLVRPIRANALVQWLLQTANDLQMAPQEQEPEHWVATEPASLPMGEPLVPVQAAVKAAVIDAVDTVATAQAAVKSAAVAKTQTPVKPVAAVQATVVANAASLGEQQLDHESRYLLRRWPPAQIVGNDPKRLRITSLLAKQALQVDELSNLSGASREECEGWMSTLLHSELLETRLGTSAASPRASKQAEDFTASNGQVQGEETTLAPKRALSLVGAIRRRLGI